MFVRYYYFQVQIYLFKQRIISYRLIFVNFELPNLYFRTDLPILMVMAVK